MRPWLQFIFLLLTPVFTVSAHIPRATETNTVSRVLASGKVNGLVTTVPFLDGQPMPVAVLAVNDTNSPPWPYRWQSPLELATGVHQLKLEVRLPFFTNTATSTFTNNFTPPRATNAYDFAGNVTKRVWLNGTNVARTQTLSWDARGRLWKVTERDALTNGYNWSAVYDAFGRRLQTTIIVTNGPLRTNATTTIVQYFDPDVEFLEVGVSVNGQTTWKLHGPDSSGTYGGGQGTGSFDAIAPPPDLFCPVLPDARGNLHAVYDQRHGDLDRFPSRVTGYGAVPGYRPPPLGFGSDAASGSAWRGRWADITGLTWLGARYYDPESGRFLSGDPMGHGADSSLYTFCGGDPINFFDPDGRDKNPAFLLPSLMAGMNQLDQRVAGFGQMLAAGLVQGHYSSLAFWFGGPSSDSFAWARQADFNADIDRYADTALAAGWRGANRAAWLADARASADFLAPSPRLPGFRLSDLTIPFQHFMDGFGRMLGAESASIVITGKDFDGRGGFSQTERLGQAFMLGMMISPAAGIAGRAEARVLGAAKGTDFMAGRLGGELYDAGKLAQLEGYLGRREIALRVGDEFLPAGKAGGFNAAEGTLSLRSNPTQYEVWHELSHFRQFQKIGPEAYGNLSRVQKEQFVFDLLNNSPKRWNGLNFEQQQHAIDYIQRVGGIR